MITTFFYIFPWMTRDQQKFPKKHWQWSSLPSAKENLYNDELRDKGFYSTRERYVRPSLWRAHLPFNCPRLLRKLPFTWKTDHERALHDGKTSERNKTAWSCTEKVWMTHESYTSCKPFLLKNWVHMKSYISFKSKHMYVSRIKNA